MGEMNEKEKSMTKKARYSKISFNVRKRLIKRVLQEGFSIASSAKLLKIKDSTAKAIIRKYKKSGKIHIGKKEKERIRNQEIGPQAQSDNQINNRIQFQSLDMLNMYNQYQMQMLNFNGFQDFFYLWPSFYYYNSIY